jgi:predicted nucleotidyltransferase/DNA-binding transcriptional ArsR family regulator
MNKKDLKLKKDNKSYMTKLSQNWLDVLVPFSYEYNKKFSGSEIARISKIPQKSVSRYLNKLVSEGILKFEVKGNSNFYFLDLSDEKIKLILNLIESYKSFIFSKNNFLWKDVKELISFGTIVLFGSQVKGNSSSYSDIDLVIFSNKSEKLKDALRLVPKVQAQIISFEKFEKLVFSRDTLALEIINNHVLFGELDKFIDLCRRFYYG